MKAIIKKELTSLKPFIILMISLSLLTFIYNFATEAQNMSKINSLVNNFSGDNYLNYLILYLIFAFSLTSGLLIREYDEKTIEFLSAMPVSLSKVFLVKFILSVLLISIIPATDFLYGIITHLLSRNSLIPGFYPGVLLSIFSLHIFQITFLISLGILLSFFRRFSWILMALLFWLYIFLERIIPEIAVFNFFQITMLNFRGNTVVIPWKMLMYQTPILILLFLISYLVFIDPQKKLFELYERIRTRSFSKILLYLVSIFSILLFGSVLIAYSFISQDNDSPDINEMLTDDFSRYSEENKGIGTTSSVSNWYEYEYPQAFYKKAEELITYSDSVYKKISSFFNYEHTFKIHVDMTGDSRSYAGLAHWQNIYLNFSSVSEISEFEPILGHETVHVFLDNITDRRLNNDFTNNKFFHEGMAGFIEYSIFRNELSFAKLREEAAVAYALRPITLPEIVNYDSLRTYYNHTLVYNFGILFCESLVDIYGKEAVRSLLDVLAEKEETFKLTGLEKWRSTFQYAGLDIEKVFLDFQQKLIKYQIEYVETIGLIKKIRAAVDIAKKDVYIIPNKEAFIPGWSLHCIARNNETDKDESLWLRYLSSDDKFSFKKNRFPRSGFWYQLYLSKNDKTEGFYLPWQKIDY